MHRAGDEKLLKHIRRDQGTLHGEAYLLFVEESVLAREPERPHDERVGITHPCQERIWRPIRSTVSKTLYRRSRGRKFCLEQGSRRLQRPQLLPPASTRSARASMSAINDRLLALAQHEINYDSALAVAQGTAVSRRNREVP